MKKLSNKLGYSIMFIILITTVILFYYITKTHIFYDFSISKNTVVIKPVFTSSAYQKGGFYSYYKGECDQKCLTVKINEIETYESGRNALNILKTKGVTILTDIDVHKNPQILNQYKTVIMLHNEYVTQEEFDAVLSHKKVIFLYPNALYGKVLYQNNTITLVRGHSYPLVSITNGFDWQNDNSLLELDTKCKDWKFYNISNGYMLNCYPENVIHRNPQILLELAKLTN